MKFSDEDKAKIMKEVSKSEQKRSKVRAGKDMRSNIWANIFGVIIIGGIVIFIAFMIFPFTISPRNIFYLIAWISGIILFIYFVIMGIVEYIRDKKRKNSLSDDE